MDGWKMLAVGGVIGVGSWFAIAPPLALVEFGGWWVRIGAALFLAAFGAFVGLRALRGLVGGE